MASNSDVAPGNSTLSRNYSLNAGSNRDREYDALKQQYDKANADLGTLRRRCEHAMKELEYYRQHHRAAAKMDSAQLATDLDYDNLRKCYDDLDDSHAQTMIKLELAQDETKRISKQCEEANQELTNSLRDVASLKQQLTKAYSQMDKVIRDCNKFQDALQVTQQKYEDAVKEVKQAMSFRIKANKEVQRLTDERNATMTEYNLIMSERDTVHKEMEKLSDDLAQSKRKSKLLEADNKDLLEEKQNALYQKESLRREIESALYDRDKALKECNDLREKFGEFTTKEDSGLMKSPLHSQRGAQDANSARSEIQVASFSQRQRMDNLDQANQELESLRKSLDKTQVELMKALQEAEVSKGRRDWAFSERDKIVLERESIRTLCDKMRKERDRAVSELAESLRESDAIKKQRNELLKENERVKEELEMRAEKEESLKEAILSHNHSHDSAIDSDMQEWETELLEIDLTGMSKDMGLGFELVGGFDDPHCPNNDVYVVDVAKGSLADGKLRENDCIARVNNLDCANVPKRIVMETIRNGAPIVHLVVRRRRRSTTTAASSNNHHHHHNWSAISRSSNNSTSPNTPADARLQPKVARWVHTTKLAAGGGNHGIALEFGVYVSKIADGSLAAKDAGLVVGDRILRVNHKSMDGCDVIHDAMRILNDDRNDAITLTVLKMTYLDAESTNVFIPVQRYKKENRSSQTEEPLFYHYDAPHPNRYSMEFKAGKTAQEKGSAWFREKLDLVRGRKHSKERERNRTLDQEKKKYRNSSPSPNVLASLEAAGAGSGGVGGGASSSSYEHEQVIAELDSVIESYHHGQQNATAAAAATIKRSKRHTCKDLALPEKNGGTWPKTRANIVGTLSTMGTITHRKKERAPLSILIGSNQEQDDYFVGPTSATTSNASQSTARNPTAAINGTKMSNILSANSHRTSNLPLLQNRHSSIMTGGGFAKHFPNDSYEKLAINRLSINMKSDDSLEFSHPPAMTSTSSTSSATKQRLVEKKNIMKYFRSDQYSHPGMSISSKSKYGSDSERESLHGGGGGGGGGGGHHDIPMPMHQPHLQSPLFAPRVPFPFHPHPHPHASSHSRESFGYGETPYAQHHQQPPFVSHGHSLSVEVYQKRPMLVNALGIGTQQSQLERDYHYPQAGYELVSVGTFPRKKENQRFRIPSNPSVNSKNSTGKISTGSIEPVSERSSPMPIFNVEIISPGSSSSNKRNSMPECYWSEKTLAGVLRRVHIDKSNEPLGIQINCPDGGGIFVSTVNENSLASRVGLQIGDQLLEVCGINMRNATYDLAANVLRQCGNSITMLVHSPDKFLEIDEDGSGRSEENSSSSSSSAEPTPCNSPKEIRKSLSLTVGSNSSGSSNQRTLQQASRDSQQRQSMKCSASSSEEPRYLYIETHKTSNLGISLVGGNAVGIYIHSVQRDSLAEHAGLRTGDQILEYNGTDLRQATAEEAAYELAKPADKVSVLAHYRIDRYNDIKDKPGDSLYVRCGFDRSGSDLTDTHQLYFNKDDILYVDNTMFRGNPGHWLAWKLDSEGHRKQCGIIPSKYKVEEQLLLRRSSGDLESRGTTSARRSFFRRKKHQRSGSRDSKELASFCNVSSGWYSDNGTLHEDLSLCSYQRVERLDCPEFRPVLVIGPLAEYVVDKLVNDFPDQFRKCIAEIRQNQSQLEQEISENIIVDYKRKGTFYECTTVTSIKQICNSQHHCMIDIPISHLEKLHRHHVFPIVLLIKFKSTKHIKEIKDTRFSLEKLSGKAAKEMYDHCQKFETDHRHLITAVIPAGVNITYMCTQVKAAIDSVHSKSQWVPVQ